jgi:hypothetical protein
MEGERTNTSPHGYLLYAATLFVKSESVRSAVGVFERWVYTRMISGSISIRLRNLYPDNHVDQQKRIRPDLQSINTFHKVRMSRMRILGSETSTLAIP